MHHQSAAVPPMGKRIKDDSCLTCLKLLSIGLYICFMDYQGLGRDGELHHALSPLLHQLLVCNHGRGTSPVPSSKRNIFAIAMLFKPVLQSISNINKSTTRKLMLESYASITCFSLAHKIPQVNLYNC